MTVKMHRDTCHTLRRRTLTPSRSQLAILEGDEAITRKLMDTIPVDHASECGQHGAA